MELILTKAYGLELFVLNLTACFEFALIEPTVNLQPFFSASGTHEIHHHFVGFQRNAPPIPRDVTEQAMFDLVPFARTRWGVTNFDDHSRLVGQPLKLMLPQAISVSVAAAAVSRDQQSRRFVVAFLLGRGKGDKSNI